MLVKNGDFLLREDQPYQVVCADEICFVIGKVYYDEHEKSQCTSYEDLEAYSNDETVNTLEGLKFTKLVKEE